MARESKEVEVNGVRYILNHYPGSKGVRILCKLAKMIGQPLSNVLNDVVANGGLGANVDVGGAVSVLFSNLDDKNIDGFIKEIIGDTIVFTEDGKNRQVNFDLDFAGEYDQLFELLKEILVFQYGSLKKILSKVMGMQGVIQAQQPQAVPTIKAK